MTNWVTVRWDTGTIHTRRGHSMHRTKLVTTHQHRHVFGLVPSTAVCTPHTTPDNVVWCEECVHDVCVNIHGHIRMDMYVQYVSVYARASYV